MEKNEIKKKLYKENPSAILYNVRKDGILYKLYLGQEGELSFFIPSNEIGEVIWERVLPAKLLIRWLQ